MITHGVPTTRVFISTLCDFLSFFLRTGRTDFAFRETTEMPWMSAASHLFTTLRSTGTQESLAGSSKGMR